MLGLTKLASMSMTLEPLLVREELQSIHILREHLEHLDIRVRQHPVKVGESDTLGLAGWELSLLHVGRHEWCHLSELQVWQVILHVHLQWCTIIGPCLAILTIPKVLKVNHTSCLGIVNHRQEILRTAMHSTIHLAMSKVDH